jgi:hypothetical protein
MLPIYQLSETAVRAMAICLILRIIKCAGRHRQAPTADTTAQQIIDPGQGKAKPLGCHNK